MPLCPPHTPHTCPDANPGRRRGNPATKRLSYGRALFLIGIIGGGVELGPLSTAATNRPTVPAPGVYDDGEVGGMMIGRGN
jgi:hypothetical protein